MPSAKRLRSVCWTLNNYTAEEEQHIKDGVFKFCVFQRETGAEGTPHLQGYCQTAGSTPFNTWKKLLSPRAHIEAPKGSPRDNYVYCTKDDTRDPGTQPFVKGDIPVPGERTDIDGVARLAMDPTKRMRDIVEANPEAFCKFHKGLAAIRTIYSEPRDFPTEVYWFYGATGTGKSKLANELAPNAYWKPGGDNWWDGYDPAEHDDVIIDDFRSNLCPFSQLLRLFDRYSLRVPFKGGYTNFRARRIYVTTSKHPNETWLTLGEEALDQLLRRLKVIAEFLPGGIKRFDKGLPNDIPDNAVVDPADAFDWHDQTEAALDDEQWIQQHRDAVFGTEMFSFDIDI